MELCRQPAGESQNDCQKCHNRMRPTDFSLMNRTTDIGREWNHRFADVKLLGNSTGVVFETVERHLSILADLDEVAVGITHVATPFPAVIV